MTRPGRSLWLCIGMVVLIGLISPGLHGNEYDVTPSNIDDVLSGASLGDVLVLSPGVYSSLRVDTPLTLTGPREAVIDGNGAGHVLEITADSTAVSGLTIRGSGRNLSLDHAGILVRADEVHLRNLLLEHNLHGIYIKEGTGASIVGNRIETSRAGEGGEGSAGGMHHDHGHVQEQRGNGIHFWRSENNVVRDNRISGVRDGVYFSFTNQTEVVGNRVSDVRYGLHYMYSDDNRFRQNEFFRSVAGAAIMFSSGLDVRENVFRDNHGYRAFGLLLQDVERSEFRDNRFDNNRIGVIMHNTFYNRFIHNHWHQNRSSLRLAGSARDNIFTRNRFGVARQTVELSGPAPENQWSADGRGNFWYGYRGIDLNGDGIGLLPHHEVDVLASRRDDFAYIDLLSESPAVRLLNWLLQRVPLPGARYITDNHPLIGTSGGS